MTEYNNKGVYCPLLHFCKEYPEKCSLFYNQSYMKCTIYCQYFDFLGKVFDTFLDNVAENKEEEELESFKTWIDRELTQMDEFYRKTILDHLKTHLKVSKDQLKGIDKEKLFWDFDNAIKKQIQLLSNKKKDNKVFLIYEEVIKDFEEIKEWGKYVLESQGETMLRIKRKIKKYQEKKEENK